MIYYPLETLINAGITDIMIVSGRGFAGHFIELLGTGREFGVNFTYKIQNHPSGIAHGFKMAKDFVGEHNVALILGDNIFFDDMLKLYHEDSPYKATPTVFLKKVTDPHRFGCVEFKKKDGSIKSIVEKPLQPPSDMIVTGLYIYPSTVFDVIDKLKPSKRGEYEISEVSDIYAKRKELKYKILKEEWIDAGTFKSLLIANEEIGK